LVSAGAAGGAKGKGNAKGKKSAAVAEGISAGPKWELFDLSADYGETIDVSAKHPEVVADLIANHDAWWKECRPLMVNENAVGPAENPFKVMYREQTGK
jgi:arylsulfatase